MTNKILVVDDEVKIVRTVRAYLEQAGFTVLTAHDGNTAAGGLSTRPTGTGSSRFGAARAGRSGRHTRHSARVGHAHHHAHPRGSMNPIG